MKFKHILLTFIALSSVVFSCNDYLDIPPKNVVQNKDLFSDNAGMAIYLANMYRQMPFEDFKWSPLWGFNFDWLVSPGVYSGTSLGRGWVGGAFVYENRDGASYWSEAFSLLRDANRLIETLPEFESNFSEAEYNHYMGEAYFARAMVFYNMAKRYGGAPLITSVLKYPEVSAEDLEIPRSTEEETWNQALADYDQAIELLSETSPRRGYANKYVALSFKSEAMLYAGSVAKYSTFTGFGQKTGVRVVGFDPNTSAAASKKYFMEAYIAAREVMKSGRYSLYLTKWAPGDKEAQYQNMVDMFFDASSTENIYIKEYSYPDVGHGYDAYNSSIQITDKGYSTTNCPTLDFIEMFDGFEKNEDGTIKVLDDNGKYLMFDKVTDLFANAEPRLHAYVILPGEEFKGEALEIRRGIFTGDVSDGIDPLRVVNGGAPDYTLAGPNNYNQVDAYKATGNFTEKALFLSASRANHEIVALPDGTSMNAGGRSGPFTGDETGARTGFLVRKWLNPDMPNELRQNEATSDQHFIVMRYAEILLNAAEAGYELMLAGESGPGSDDFRQIAYEAIRDIRERAGADPLDIADLTGQEGLEIIRIERQKELAFEWHRLWDLKRWRTYHSRIINGRTHEDGVYYKGLYPFYNPETGKYFFDAGLAEYRMLFRFTEQNYYLPIAGGEVAKSPVIDQQPGR